MMFSFDRKPVIGSANYHIQEIDFKGIVTNIFSEFDVIHWFIKFTLRSSGSVTSKDGSKCNNILGDDCIIQRFKVSISTLIVIRLNLKILSDDWPQTSYLKAIDVWTIFCYLGAFFCLIEYSVVLYLTKNWNATNPEVSNA